MMAGRLVIQGFIGAALLAAAGGAALAAEAPQVTFTQEPGRVVIAIGGRPTATYVYADKDIPRPYFAHVRAPDGVQVTRNYPPVAGKDATDHPTFHPGIWMAFGDISGSDFWRNKARVVHDRFVQGPAGGAGHGAFAVYNRYLSASGNPVCTELCRFTIDVRTAGYLLMWDSTFSASDLAFAFGDQEEMGLGVRVATPITVKAGGRILDSEGHVNEAQVRGKTPAWCDYGGTIDGQRVGVTLMSDPANFRPSWLHARDYGALVANPFGRKALGKGQESKVVVEPGKPLRLRYGVLIHGAGGAESPDLKAAYADFLSLLGK
jgi:hypothetical protein